MVINLNLTDQDLLRLEMIEIDKDEAEALLFLREKILPEVKRHKGLKMQSHLDGGKGSAF